MIDPAPAVAVTGIGVASPYGIGLPRFEEGLLSSSCRLAPLRRFAAGFDATAAEFPGTLSEFDARGRRTSRTAQLAVVAAMDVAADLPPSDSGVVMATTVAGLSELEPELVSDPAAWYRRGGLGRAACYPITHVAEAAGDCLGAGGPRCAVNVACASGAMAIALAAQMLLDGAAPVMFAGGSDALCPFTLSGFHSLQALDPDPCRPFDQDRRGLNIGEGAAIFRLETFAGARARGVPILATLLGWAMTNDAHHLTAPHDQGRGLAACIAATLHMAGVTTADVGYVNAHGTGTPLNDAAETRAYEAAFHGRAQPIPVSSTKSYFGHCLGAAGALEAAVAVIAVCRGVLLPTLRLARPVESTAVDWLMGAPRRQPLAIAMSVSAGFGGSNTALLFGGPA
jgi:3-oxoacyl-[acyl-carrier-protein] synthase II